jgi:hydrogenase maturation protein HypF
MSNDARTISSFVIPPAELQVRCRWRVSGRVQGVGFRPFVYRLAKRLHITGAVWNDAAGVVIEGQGTQQQLVGFIGSLQSEAPAAAAIHEIQEEAIPRRSSEINFEIHCSDSTASVTAEVTPDLAVCEECRADIRNANNPRRHRYALTNCTNCGPRFSIVRAIPYDRRFTTMSIFPMCGACRREYEDPADRRFHAQPTACHHCGPQLELVDSQGQAIQGDPITATARRLIEGQIVAIKGVGGFHLAVRADDPTAVARLRALKNRPAKPFALMCSSPQSARRLVALSTRGVELMNSPAAPIVLARRTATAPVAPAVAPNNHRLGVMLGYTPLHHLIFDELCKFGVETLVMTSGNDVDEPLVFDDQEAVARLGRLCDVVLRHGRRIQRPVDDSVLIDTGSQPIFVRRSRGYAPEPIPLSNFNGAPPGLALGAELKNTVATCRDGQVVLSQHLGNLTQGRTFEAFKRAISDLCTLFAVTPRWMWIAHDLHPIYLSTQHAKKLAAEWRVPLIAVQHHHAHAAAVLAEHGLTGPSLAIVCDGTGYGEDGGIWGGELLVADLHEFHRVGRLRPIHLPGGDAAARQPWRSALALLFAAFGKDFQTLPICAALAEKSQIHFIRQMLITRFSCVASSSTGRVFDGVAALLGLCLENRFDAEAPAALETAASQYTGAVPLIDNLYEIHDDGGLIEIDLAPLIQKIVHGAMHRWPAPDLAMLFHTNFASAWATAIDRAMRQTGLKTVVLGGGVFCNELFSDLLARRLRRLGAQVLRSKAVPPNDGGIAFGQAAVAAARLQNHQHIQSRRLACV